MYSENKITVWRVFATFFDKLSTSSKFYVFWNLQDVTLSNMADVGLYNGIKSFAP